MGDELADEAARRCQMPSEVRLERQIIQEVLEEGSCPFHLRLRLKRGLLGEGNGSFTATLASFLPVQGLLALRGSCSEMIIATMRQLSVATADLSRPSSSASVHDRIRLRLLLEKASQVAAKCREETVFETRVRSYVDDTLRRRLEADVLEAKMRMENEVREAKVSMLACVQAISDEVDRRVRQKVQLLQVEFERSRLEQARLLQEEMQRRVTEQTAALKEEIERRSDCVRLAVEGRHRAQEELAEKLKNEVARIRTELEARFDEQEAFAKSLSRELDEVRSAYSSLAKMREALERRANEQEDSAIELRRQLLDLRALSHVVEGSRGQRTTAGFCMPPLRLLLRCVRSAVGR